MEIKVEIVDLVLRDKSYRQRPDVRQIRTGVVCFQGLHNHILHINAESVGNPWWKVAKYLLLSDLAVDYKLIVQRL